MSTTNTQTIISQLTDAELCLLEQLTYLDEDVAKTAFGKDNYDDLDFYKISNWDIGSTIFEILEDFNDIAIANLRMHPEEICDAAISGMEWASIIEQLKSNENLKNLVLRDILLDESGYHTVTDAIRYEYPYPLALCFTDDSDSPSDAVIAYKGTTGETEWADNVGGAYKAKTEPQTVALDFANAMGEKYSDITVTGHSKGANKAMFVSIFASSVTRCVCFDGQGFSSEFYKDSTVWKRIRERASIITNYALSSDFVHILLNQIPGSNQYYCEGYGVDSIMENHSLNSFLKQTDWNSMNISKSNLEHYWNLINRVLEYEKIVDDNPLNVIEALYDLYPKYDFFAVYDLSYVEQHTYAKELTQIFRESVVNQIPDSSLGSLIGLYMNLIDEDAELASFHELASSLVAIGDQDMLEYIIESFIGTMILTYHNDGTEITKNEKFNSLFADSEMLAKIAGRTLYYMNRMDNLNLDYINNLLEAFHAEPIVGLLGWVIQKVDDSLIDNIFGGEDDWALKSLAWASAKKEVEDYISKSEFKNLCDMIENEYFVESQRYQVGLSHIPVVNDSDFMNEYILTRGYNDMQAYGMWRDKFKESGGVIIKGDGNNNVIFASDEKIAVLGGWGDDVIYGNDIGCILHGDVGDDTIFSGTGDDWIFGETGDGYICTLLKTSSISLMTNRVTIL